MLDPTIQTEITTLRTQLRSTGLRVANASGKLDLERALEGYLMISLRLHGLLTESTRSRMADSISNGPTRCPPVLITSSSRPTNQK